MVPIIKSFNMEEDKNAAALKRFSPILISIFY
jgi:hypothetical protein